jgi:small subunit ribosomal protein S17
MDTTASGQKNVRTTRRKTITGRVTSTGMEKSIVVTIEQRIAHPIYKKIFKQSRKYMAHDEQQDAKIGDLVRIMETRPLSKRKRWRLVEVVERAK